MRDEDKSVLMEVGLVDVLGQEFHRHVGELVRFRKTKYSILADLIIYHPKHFKLIEDGANYVFPGYSGDKVLQTVTLYDHNLGLFRTFESHGILLRIEDALSIVEIDAFLRQEDLPYLRGCNAVFPSVPIFTGSDYDVLSVFNKNNFGADHV